MSEYKKLNEVKKGDKLYCHHYLTKGGISIIPLTVKEVVTDGPYSERKIYSKEAIVIKEKVPNSPENTGEFVIDQYYRDDVCNLSNKFGIYTTYAEAKLDAIGELFKKYRYYEDEIKNLKKIQENILDSIENFSIIDA